MSSLNIDSTERSKALVIQISGDAGVDNVGQLGSELARLASSHPAAVVFDLSGLDYIASLGMGILLAFRQTIVRQGGVVRIAAAKPMVLDAFKRAALRALFNTCDTVDEALTPPA